MDIEKVIKELNDTADHPPEGPDSHFVAEACEDAVDCIEQLQQRVKDLESDLKKAIGMLGAYTYMDYDWVHMMQDKLKGGAE